MPQWRRATPIILDCDPGHDDAVAIVVAARHADLLGITTVGGNAPLERTTYNARVMRDLLDVDVPVHSGADRPLVEPLVTGPAVHGASGPRRRRPAAAARARSTAPTPSASSSRRAGPPRGPGSSPSVR